MFVALDNGFHLWQLVRFGRIANLGDKNIAQIRHVAAWVAHPLFCGFCLFTSLPKNQIRSRFYAGRFDGLSYFGFDFFGNVIDLSANASKNVRMFVTGGGYGPTEP